MQRMSHLLSKSIKNPQQLSLLYKNRLQYFLMILLIHRFGCIITPQKIIEHFLELQILILLTINKVLEYLTLFQEPIVLTNFGLNYLISILEDHSKYT